MRNIVENNDGTYNFDLGVYHYTNVPKWYMEALQDRQTCAMLFYEAFILDPGRKSLTQKAREMRW